MAVKYYEGRVHTVIFENPERAFYILKMELEEDGDSMFDVHDPLANLVTVRGSIPGIPVTIGTWFGFEGRYETHPKYKRQLVIKRAPVLRDGWDPDTAEKMLTSNGVAHRIVAQIRLHFGDDQFVQALGDKKRLAEVPGLSTFSAAHVAGRWEATRAYFQTVGFLNDLGLPAGKIGEIWKRFGDEAEAILSKNPWALVQVDGIKFTQADEIAQRLNLDLTDPNRIRGGVLYCCKDNRSFGHTFLTTGQIFAMLRASISDLDKRAVGEALVSLHKEKFLVIDRKTKAGVTAVYEPWSHHMEVVSADMLVKRVTTAAYQANDPAAYIRALGDVGPLTEAKGRGGNLDEVARTAVEEWGTQARLVLSEAQKQGVINALVHPVSILTGLPGTGKTTSLRAAVRILQDADIPFLLCAPTGIAAKRLEQLTGAEASTIHRAFKAKGSSDDKREATYAGIIGDRGAKIGAAGEGEVWEFNQDNPHPARVVIIDEASMVDQHLLFRLLDCTAPNCRLMFVGDYAQLPSVGPGNVLRDLINSDRFPVVKLTEIFRQEDTSDIVFAAHAVHRGEVPETSNPKSDFVLVQAEDDETVHKTILKLAKKLYHARRNFQILSPKHGGIVGVTRLNEALRELLNPKQPGLSEIQIGSDTMREDDRIMIVQNDYKLGVFNGDVGKVSSVDRSSKQITAKIFGEPPMMVPIDFNKVSGLVRLAYACTVHKAQGLEYDVIVVPVVESFKHQLQRNLYYTAITRARKKVILVGTRAALRQAVLNSREDARNTLFLERLQGALEEAA